VTPSARVVVGRSPATAPETRAPGPYYVVGFSAVGALFALFSAGVVLTSYEGTAILVAAPLAAFFLTGKPIAERGAAEYTKMVLMLIVMAVGAIIAAILRGRGGSSSSSGSSRSSGWSGGGGRSGGGGASSSW